jgi:hypothetical protein
MNLLGPVPWLKLLAAGVLFAMGLYVGTRWTQGRWDAATVAQAQLVAQVAAQDEAKEHAQQKANEERINALQKVLAESAANGADLAGRLRAYRARTCPVPAAPGEPTVTAGPGVATAPAGPDAALAAYDAGCQRDAARLAALSAEIRAQL